MKSARPPRSLDELTLDSKFNIQELISRESLEELLRSLHELFGVSLRVFATDGALFAEAGPPSPLQAYLSSLPGGRRIVRETVEIVKAAVPDSSGDLRLQGSTGEQYGMVALTYDGRTLGRAVIGPYWLASDKSLPASLVKCDPLIDAARLEQAWSELPRSDAASIARLLQHGRSTLDLVLFSGHRALLASNMHVASVQESYRELSEKSATLQTAYERLKELDRLKSNFLATVSHELRTPLTSIIGYSEMLAEGLAGEMTAEQREFVQTIRDKGEQLLQLIKGLLDLSKLESGTMSLRKSQTDILTVLRDVSQTMTPTARKTEVEIVVEVENGLPLIWADAERLRQVFLNLTENAIKFTPPGGKVTLS